MVISCFHAQQIQHPNASLVGLHWIFSNQIQIYSTSIVTCWKEGPFIFSPLHEGYFIWPRLLGKDYIGKDYAFT